VARLATLTANPVTPVPYPFGTPSTRAPKTGIRDYGGNSPEDWIVSIFNVYSDGVSIVMFAGSSVTDPTQGVVGMRKDNPSDGSKPSTLVNTPGKHGFVRITAVNGSVVSLVAKDGTTFTFDYDTLKFT